MKVNSLGQFLLFAGIFRSVSTLKIFLHLPIFVFGFFYIIRRRRIDFYLAASALLGLQILLSCYYNGLGVDAYFKALMIFGAIGISEFVKRQNPEMLASTVAGKVLFFCIIALAIETALISLGFGERARALGALVGGAESSGGTLLPRYMGFRGGSAYTAMMLGVLGLLCLAYRYKWQGIVFFTASLLMMSRGPLLATIALVLYFIAKKVRLHKGFAFVACIGVVLSPAVVALLMKTLPLETQIYLIEVSTMRYFHWVSFLNFGLQNPFFGIGYDNFKEYYIAYSYTSDALEYGYFTENRLLEAHNMMMDIIGELGFVATALWAVQITTMLFLAAKGTAKFLPMLLYICVCSAFISSLSDWCIWFCFGLVIGNARFHWPDNKLLETA